MEDPRFDSMARFISRAFDRRGLTVAIAATIAGAATAERSRAADRKKKKRCLADGKRCGKNSGNKGRSCKWCCSKFSSRTSDGLIPDDRRRCACRPDGMTCKNDTQCCNGVCNAATSLCDDALPADPPIVCESSTNFCVVGSQNCAQTTNCYCVTTTAGENYCTNGNFNCSPIYNNVTCNDDNDCENDYGDGWACVPMSSCPSVVKCSGANGTACVQICGM